jgi:hypothetical protein
MGVGTSSRLSAIEKSGVASGPTSTIVKLRRIQCEHTFSALLSNSDDEQTGVHQPVGINELVHGE